MDLKQTLSYGFGVFASCIDKQKYKGALKAINSMINDKDAFSDDNVVATESAIGALGKIIYAQKDNSNNIKEDLIKLFLSKLPLTHEEEEA